MQLEQIMVKNVATVSTTDSIVVAANRMRQRNVGYLVVTNAGEVRGVITDRDLAIRCLGKEHTGQACRVADHMSSPPVTAPPDMDVGEAARLMRSAKIKRLPIVVEDHLVGLVSFSGDA